MKFLFWFFSELQSKGYPSWQRGQKMQIYRCARGMLCWMSKKWRKQFVNFTVHVHPRCIVDYSGKQTFTVQVLSICLELSICLSACMPVCLSACLFIVLLMYRASFILSVHIVKAINQNSYSSQSQRMQTLNSEPIKTWSYYMYHTCSWHKTWENECKWVTIDFAFTSDWMKQWCEVFKPIVWHRWCKTDHSLALKWKLLSLYVKWSNFCQST